MSEHLAESVALTIEDAKEHGLSRVAVSVGLLDATLEKINEHASLTEKVERLEKALGQDAIVGFVNANGGREVHRSWRDNMLHQDRGLRIEYMEWDTLPISDQDLDRAISLDVLLDYSTWVIGHALLESAGEKKAACRAVAERHINEHAALKRENKRYSGALYDAMCLTIEHDDDIFSDIRLDHLMGVALLTAQEPE